LLTLRARLYRRRLVLLPVIVLVHVLVIPNLARLHLRMRTSAADTRATTIFINFPMRPAEMPGQPGLEPASALAASNSTADRQSHAIAAPIRIDDARDREPVDWIAQGERAAQVAASEKPAPRSFGIRAARDPPARPQKPFHWDKTHTQRFEALPEGGMLIRLSDRCQLTIAPLPLGGCSLGKIEARGDLFDGMNKPVEFGDWKEGLP
jgi:hypothetical protein